jgi:Bromodomain
MIASYALTSYCNCSCSPQRARRKSTKKAFIASRNTKKRDRNESFSNQCAAASLSALSPLSEATPAPLGICNNVATLLPTATSTTTDRMADATMATTAVTKNGILLENGALDYPAVTLGMELEPSCISYVKLKETPMSSTTTKTLLSKLKDPPLGIIMEDAHTAPILHDNSNVSATENNTKPIRFKALQDDGKTLDIYAYHRGREGSELRDEQTGELLWDAVSSDTNHAADEPKSLIAIVTIQFPLEQETDLQSGAEQEIRYYREAMQWDLTHPETPNPLIFATGIAQDFGLSHTQTWELAESIQSQLLAFVHENCAYASPVLISREQHDKPALMVPHLYGECTGFLQQGGICHPFTQKPKALPQVQRAASFTLARTTSATGGQRVSGKLPAKRRSSGDTRKVAEAFYQQVRTRLHEASAREIHEKASSYGMQGVGNQIQPHENHICHLCQQTQPVCGVFACGISSHAYCVNHLSERLGLIGSSASLQLDYCPVCSLACTCIECVTKLDATAIDFKSKCQEQEVTPENTTFVDLLGHCRKLQVHNGGDKKPQSKGIKWKKSRSGLLDRRPCVPKIPISEFPREVANGIDMDFGFDTEYRTVFTEKGSFLVTSTSAANGDDVGRATPPAGEQVPVEDGSVDFCNVCKKVGNLLCCDYCPRAFHSECIPSEALQQGISEVTHWECPCCRQEKDGLLEDKIDGNTSLPAICAAIGSLTTKKGDLQSLELLSILHEMLGTLMDYDFGYMFGSPVDYKQIPSYKTIVKKPMDLGTISSNMLKGTYNDDSLEDVALAVLKDIDLVWHNCFIFNVEGSAVYRMAQVLDRRALSIRRRSFDHFLSDRVKQELADYVDALNKERNDYRRLELPTFQRKPSATPASKARHKIAGSCRAYSKGRPIGVLDPDTGMLAKIYTTMLSASNAVSFLVNLKKHVCEWEPKDIDSQGKLRKIILQCQEDASVRLYGFRWTFLDDLRNGKISFVCRSSRENGNDSTSDVDDDPVSGLIEMVDGGISYFFNSIEEALSFHGFPDGMSYLRNRLQSLAPSVDFVQVAGRMWRRYLPETTSNGRGCVDVRPSLQRTPGSSANEPAVDDVSCLPGVEIVKEDLISGERTLVGFPHVAAAFQDWCRTLDSMVLPYLGRRELDIFLQYYLDGDRNIDGMRWRSVARREPDDNVVVESNSESSDRMVATSLSCLQPETTSALAQSTTEGPRSSRGFGMEPVPSPKPANQKSDTTNGMVLNGLSDNCQLPPPNVSSLLIDEAEESIGRGESSVHSSANKEATAVG